jgi:hypothetical protein
VMLSEFLRNARNKAQQQAENPTAVNRVVAETLALKRQKPIDRGVGLTHGLGKMAHAPLSDLTESVSLEGV